MPDITSTTQMLALAAIAGYLLGSIPFGMVVARVMGLGNLREIGSGNIGATNVLRTGNKTAAALTVLLDAGKGAVALLVARALIGEDAAQIAGLAAFLGHLFPIWLRFRGGKGGGDFSRHLAGIILAAGAGGLRHMAVYSNHIADVFAGGADGRWVVANVDNYAGSGSGVTFRSYPDHLGLHPSCRQH